MHARMATTKTSRTGMSNIVKENLGNMGCVCNLRNDYCQLTSGPSLVIIIIIIIIRTEITRVSPSLDVHVRKVF